jgi:hypothetical protein
MFSERCFIICRLSPNIYLIILGDQDNHIKVGRLVGAWERSDKRTKLRSEKAPWKTWPQTGFWKTVSEDVARIHLAQDGSCEYGKDSSCKIMP